MEKFLQSIKENFNKAETAITTAVDDVSRRPSLFSAVASNDDADTQKFQQLNAQTIKASSQVKSSVDLKTIVDTLSTYRKLSTDNTRLEQNKTMTIVNQVEEEAERVSSRVQLLTAKLEAVEISKTQQAKTIETLENSRDRLISVVEYQNCAIHKLEHFCTEVVKQVEVIVPHNQVDVEKLTDTETIGKKLETVRNNFEHLQNNYDIVVSENQGLQKSLAQAQAMIVDLKMQGELLTNELAEVSEKLEVSINRNATLKDAILLLQLKEFDDVRKELNHKMKLVLRENTDSMKNFKPTFTRSVEKEPIVEHAENLHDLMVKTDDLLKSFDLEQTTILEELEVAKTSREQEALELEDEIQARLESLGLRLIKNQ